MRALIFGKWAHIGAVGALLGAMAGCAPRTDIQTNKDQNYAGEPHRLIVIEALGPLSVSHKDSFQADLSQRLKSCSVTANYVLRPLTELSDAQKAKENAFIQKFGPDTLLGITETKYTVQTVSRDGIVMSKGIAEIVYEGELVDVPAKKTVWKAQITLHTGEAGFGDPGTQLADDVVARLAQDGIFHACAQ